jgi:hypothetical protein
MCLAFVDDVPDAALALVRWSAVERACERRRSDSERRFRRRAYERARDRALVAVALHRGPVLVAAGPAPAGEQGGFRAAGGRSAGAI